MKLLSIAVLFAFLFLLACDNALAPNQSNIAQQTLITEMPENPLAAPDSAEVNYELVMIKEDLPSPRKEVRFKMADTKVSVNYGSPSKNGRNIWGGLVPFGKVWRTGANEATTFSTSQDILVEGQRLAAGTYGLFSFPTRDAMQIIFNSVADQWGAFDYDETKDVLRVEVETQATKSSAETMDFSVVGNTLVLRWANRLVPVSLAPITD